MAKEKNNTKKMPLTFRDTGYTQRTIKLVIENETHELHVKNSLVTVQDAVMIEALDSMYGLKKEKK